MKVRSLGLLFFFLAALAACERQKEDLSVVVFVVDTLRADHVGAYGYQRDTTPAIDGLAEEGVVFEQAVSAAPRTWQSFVSILTGLFPPRHGVREIFGEPLAEDVPSLPRILARSGYVTVAFDGMNFLKGMTGGHAFESYVNVSEEEGLEGEGDVKIVNAFVRWLEQVPADRPFFAFLRLGDPHWPYACPPVFHAVSDEENGIDHSFNWGGQGVDLREGELRLTDRTEYRRRYYGPYRAEVVEHMKLHYDECVRSSDAAIARGLEALREAGRWERTLVVVTSDHGESFGENGYFQHGPRVDDPVMLVPLVVRFPPPIARGRRGKRVPGLVRTVDIMPTVLDALGLEVPAGLDGVSLLPAIDSGRRLGLVAYGEAGRAFPGVDPEVYFDGVKGKWRMVRTDRWKLVYVPTTDGPLYRLFDVRAGDEKTDVSSKHPEVVSSLKQELDRIFASEGHGPGESMPLTEEQKEQLRQLGYM